MQNSEPHDSSSLQAILYVDRVDAAKEQSRQPSRLPNAAAMGICVLAAACAVGAFTYKFKQAPSFTIVSNADVHVTHAAAAPHIIVESAVQQHRDRPGRVQHVQPNVVAQTSTTHVTSTTPVHIQRAPQLVAVAAATPTPAKSPIAKVTTAKKVAVHQALVKTKIATKVALHSAAPTSSITRMHVSRATKPMHHIAYHHHVHRRFAAVNASATSSVHYAVLAQNSAPSVADPTITRFDAAPSSIPEGSGASLCVAAHHATQLSISGIGEVNPLLIDCRHVNPVVTTTYTAWAVNKLGVTVSQNVTITVTH